MTVAPLLAPELLNDCALNPHERVLVAVSGGLDSMVLLQYLLTHRLALRVEVAHIVHQHQRYTRYHDLQKTTQDFCQRNNIPLHLHHAPSTPQKKGLEEADRNTRYHFFAQCAQTLGISKLFLGHHANDQAETLLLRLFRGTGTWGAAAMQKLQLRQQLTLCRPFLTISRETLKSYAKQHTIPWVEDDFNRDPYFSRNYIRHNVLPTIEQRFHNVSAVLARNTAVFNDDKTLLNELAELDLNAHYRTLDSLYAPNTLSLTRQKNLLRFWLHRQSASLLNGTGSFLPNAKRLEEWLRQAQQHSASLNIKNEGYSITLRAWKDYWFIELKSASAKKVSAITELKVNPQEGVLWQPFYHLPENRLQFSGAWPATVTLRTRHHGDSVKTHSHRPQQDIKTLFHRADIPPWRRALYPLIVDAKNRILMIPGVASSIEIDATQKCFWVRAKNKE